MAKIVPWIIVGIHQATTFIIEFWEGVTEEKQGECDQLRRGIFGKQGGNEFVRYHQKYDSSYSNRQLIGNNGGKKKCRSDAPYECVFPSQERGTSAFAGK